MKGLLFTPEMARAVCEGRKTVTRRVVVPQWSSDVETVSEMPATDRRTGWMVSGHSGRWDDEHGLDEVRRAPVVPGDRVCLLTTWAAQRDYDLLTPTFIAADLIPPVKLWHAGLGPKPGCAGKSRPGRFLPNRLRPFMPALEIVSVRAERVQDITEGDAKAEGVAIEPDDCWGTSQKPAVAAFVRLWDSINAKRGFGWAENPWVWRIELRRIV